MVEEQRCECQSSAHGHRAPRSPPASPPPAGAAIAAQLDASVLQRIFALVAVLVGAQALVTATRALRTGPAPVAAPAGEAA